MWRNLLPLEIFRGLFLFSFVQNGSFCPVGSGKRKSFRFFWPKRWFLSRGYWREKSFRSFWPKPWFLSRGYWRMKRFRILSCKTAPHVRWVVKEKNFRKSGPLHRFLSRGYWREKVSDFFVQNGPNCQGGTGEKKVSELFGQTAHFPPVGTEVKKFPKKRTTSPVFVQWVLKEEFFKIFRSKTAKPSSG